MELDQLARKLEREANGQFGVKLVPDKLDYHINIDLNGDEVWVWIKDKHNDDPNGIEFDFDKDDSIGVYNRVESPLNLTRSMIRGDADLTQRLISLIQGEQMKRFIENLPAEWTLIKSGENRFKEEKSTEGTIHYAHIMIDDRLWILEATTEIDNGVLNVWIDFETPTEDEGNEHYEFEDEFSWRTAIEQIKEAVYHYNNELD